VKKFLEEVRGEFSKVIWPGKVKVINATTLVILLSIAVGIYLGAFDLVFSKLLSFIVR